MYSPGLNFSQPSHHPPPKKYSALPLKPPPPKIFSSGKTLSCCVLVCRNTCTVYLMPKAPSVCVCVCSNIFSETTWPFEAKFHVKPPWDRGRKVIQMVQVICCSSLLSAYGGRGFLQGFYHKFVPAVQGVWQGFKNWKVKSPGPVGVRYRNDWYVTFIDKIDVLWV